MRVLLIQFAVFVSGQYSLRPSGPSSRGFFAPVPLAAADPSPERYLRPRGGGWLEKILDGSFSAVSKPNVASKYSFESS